MVFPSTKNLKAMAERRAKFDHWKSNYKSMSFEQLLTAKVPIGLSVDDRNERMAFIASELRIKAPHDTNGESK